MKAIYFDFDYTLNMHIEKTTQSRKYLTLLELIFVISVNLKSLSKKIKICSIVYFEDLCASWHFTTLFSIASAHFQLFVINHNECAILIELI